VHLQAQARALLARARTDALRRRVRATRIQSAMRRCSQSMRFRAMRAAALRVQSLQRMRSQRKQYLRDLADKKEEAKLSTQIARLQAQLQAEMEARKHAEEEQERLRTEKVVAPSATNQPSAVQPGEEAASENEDSAPESVGSRLLGGAAKLLSSYTSEEPQTTSSMQETSAMLSLVTKDREKLSQKLAAETEARKKLEVEKRELERKMRIGSATSQLETKKTRDVGEALARKKDEITEMRQMLQNQTLDIANLQQSKAAANKRIAELEKKISQYDDSFYALEARNVRDRTKMEEMTKAKNQAEEEKNVYRLMLEQAHERSLKERQELRRDAHSKIEASAARIRVKQQRIVQLEKQLHEKAQVEEEVKMYREQYNALAEQFSGGGQQSATSPRPSPRPQSNASSSPANAASVFDRMAQRVRRELTDLSGSQ